MDESDVITSLLLALFVTLLAAGAMMVIFVARTSRRQQQGEVPIDMPFCTTRPSKYARRPACWLAVRSSDMAAVQLALEIHNPQPCSWMEGIARDAKLFIAPPLRGWTLVMGSVLPDPGEDVDACFRLVLEMSRRLGEAQFFGADPMSGNHAWVIAGAGRVVRAYAWAGRTLWNQGARTAAERQLGLRCFDYADDRGEAGFGQPDELSANVEKVPLLAARWSLDPGAIEDRFFEAGRGVAGELTHRF